ncbi:alpha/beta-hydrolase [Thozetella sp. PMI_491]|nr:alpha/beta-hydrolase [Thozetella sp. PMI_491]
MLYSALDASHRHETVVHGRNAQELKRGKPALLSKMAFASHVCSVQGILASLTWLQDWKEYFYPPDTRPNLIKKYEARRHLPVRVFFPATYDQTSQQTLPLLLSIHGGGFCWGRSHDDDVWNRTFADRHNVLVVSLSYSKAPWAPFPGALHDLEAVILAVFADESLPIDRSSQVERHGLSRTAVIGFSAGGNLALAVSQLESIRTHALAPAAAVSVYGCLDLSVAPHEKLSNRPFKPALGPPRGALVDMLMQFCPTFDWSYIPYEHDLRDPLLSPEYAPREHLPRYVGLVAAELDMMSHEGWRLACRLANEGVEAQGGKFVGKGRLIPERESKEASERICGQEPVSDQRGSLSVTDSSEGSRNNERFAFEDEWEDGGVKWLLVPDVLHAFDNPVLRKMNALGDMETVRDAEIKTVLYTDEVAAWLKGKVWRV